MKNSHVFIFPALRSCISQFFVKFTLRLVAVRFSLVLIVWLVVLFLLILHCCFVYSRNTKGCLTPIDPHRLFIYEVKNIQVMSKIYLLVLHMQLSNVQFCTKEECCMIRYIVCDNVQNHILHVTENNKNMQFYYYCHGFGKIERCL